MTANHGSFALVPRLRASWACSLYLVAFVCFAFFYVFGGSVVNKAECDGSALL
jgi:hypothetical protein